MLSLCTGIGALIAFVYGWIKSSEWGLRKVMLAWSICLAINLLLAFAAAIGAAMFVPVNRQPVRQVNHAAERFIASAVRESQCASETRASF